MSSCSCGGGGAFDQAAHQRRSVIHGASQARTARIACGQHSGWDGLADPGPPLSAAGFRCRRRGGGRRRMGEPGGPAEAERAVDQHLVTADREVGADLEVSPAQLVLDLLIPLLDPVPDPVDPHDLGQAGRRVRAARLARAAGRGRFVTRYQVALSGRCPVAVATTRRRASSGPHPPSEASRPPGLGMPVAERALHRVQSPGSSGPPQARACAASTGVCASSARAQVPRRGRAHHERQPGLASSARNPS